ncbi:MAG: cation:proton antiporter [Vicinamibacterales bacterium]
MDNSTSTIQTTSRGRLFLFYLGGITVSLALLALLLWVGNRLLGPVGLPQPPLSESEPLDTLLHLLAALAAVVITARVMGAVFHLFRQPAVIGEVVGGIMLGPSLLGAFYPEAYGFLLPPATAPYLSVVAQLGVVLYMFIVGLHLDLSVMRTSGHATIAISHASIVVPMLLGVAMAFVLYAPLAGPGAPFAPFALFLGVSLSVTAFPVLARILGDKGLIRTRLGMLALTCAAVDDVTAWCLLAFVVSVSQASVAGAFVTFGLTLVYIAVMLIVVRPIAGFAIPFLERLGPLNQGGLAVILVALLLSALATEFIGIHAIFGAFLLGAVIPHSSKVAEDVTNRLDDLVRVLFLPAFFAFTGMRTEIGLMASWQDWAMCAGIIAVATIGKFGGTFLAARVSGLERRDSAALGILMNTRGLVELIVLNIGLDIGVLSPRLFTMLVIMALVTTFMSGPALNVLMRGHTWNLQPNQEPIRTV